MPNEHLFKSVYEITSLTELHQRRDHDVAALMAESQKWFDAKTSAELRITEKDKEIARLREALEWYADPRTWNQWLPDSAGDRARKVLSNAVINTANK